MRTIQSKLLSRFEELGHAFTTRLDGKSPPPYLSNNIAFHVGDDEENVLANHRQLATHVGYRLETLVHMRQIHSDRVVIVDETHHFASPPECDALITDRKGIPLMVMSADCTPVLIYDPKIRVIAAVHAGRSGACTAIIPKTIATLEDAFGSDPSELIAVLGPSIHSCCYEISEHIANECFDERFGFSVSKRGNAYFLDINAIIKKQLEEHGVDAENIEVIPHCTSCENDLFFSYRADNKQTGRMAGVIMISD
jgi:YfiH family protein